mmetsp:Transcript_23953/g.33588  ORF Transcript_23953/g.33588 Transcript_23953/m.33588 type:complete len:161 (-) Transcript_23953:40-522(-)
MDAVTEGLEVVEGVTDGVLDREAPTEGETLMDGVTDRLRVGVTEGLREGVVEGVADTEGVTETGVEDLLGEVDGVTEGVAVLEGLGDGVTEGEHDGVDVVLGVGVFDGVDEELATVQQSVEQDPHDSDSSEEHIPSPHPSMIIVWFTVVLVWLSQSVIIN